MGANSSHVLRRDIAFLGHFCDFNNSTPAEYAVKLSQRTHVRRAGRQHVLPLSALFVIAIPARLVRTYGIGQAPRC
eukprot:26126-Eustigmatos_ZCMA.PRE.1